MVKKPLRKGLQRRDATGHLDPQYAADLLEQSRASRTSDPPPEAFVDDSDDDLATQLGGDFLQAATSAEDGDADTGDEPIKDEPLVPDGDDDDLAFEPEELAFPPARSRRTAAEPAPARKPTKLAQPRTAKSKSKSASVKGGRKAPKAKAKPKAKPKAVKTKPAKSKPARKKTKAKPARKKTGRAR